MSDGALSASASKYLFVLSAFSAADPVDESACPSFAAAPAKLRQLFATVFDEPELVLPLELSVDVVVVVVVVVVVSVELVVELDSLEPELPHAVTATSSTTP